MNKYNLRLAFYGLAVVAATFAIIFLAADEGTFRESRFWWVYAPVLISEIIAFGPGIALAGNAVKKQFPALLATAHLPFLYLGFTVLASLVYPAGASLTAIVIIQIVGFVTALGLFIFMLNAYSAVKDNEECTAAAEASRRNFRIAFDALKVTLLDRFGKEEGFRKKIDMLSDAVRWSSESVAGGESRDAAVADKINAIAAAAADGDLVDIEFMINELQNLLKQREAVLKQLR